MNDMNDMNQNPPAAFSSARRHGLLALMLLMSGCRSAPTAPPAAKTARPRQDTNTTPGPGPNPKPVPSKGGPDYTGLL